MPAASNQPAEDRLEVEIAIAQMENEDTGLRELTPIDGQRLECQEMGWDGVGAEGVDEDEVVMVIRRLSQGEAAVAQDDFDAGRCVLQVGEVPGVASQACDVGVDLVEHPLFARAGICRHGARAETDYRDSPASL